MENKVEWKMVMEDQFEDANKFEDDDDFNTCQPRRTFSRFFFLALQFTIIFGVVPSFPLLTVIMYHYYHNETCFYICFVSNIL